MYNRDTFEYREVEFSDYQQYRENADALLSDIAEWANIPVSEITYLNIFDFFTNNFDIEILYFNNQPKIITSSHSFISEKIYEVTPTFAKRVSGFNVSSGNSYKIFLQKYDSIRRIIFTLLHELVHIYFHCSNNSFVEIFAYMSIDGHYPASIIPFENEANVIASLLYLNDEKLVEYLKDGCSFDLIMSRHNISRSALHNRINNYLIYNVGLNPSTAFHHYLKPYKNEVYGKQAAEKIKFLLNEPKFFLHRNRTYV